MDEREMEVAVAVIKAVAPQLYKDGAQPFQEAVTAAVTSAGGLIQSDRLPRR